MQIGLLWYDGDPKRPLEHKIEGAADRYREKYGRWPNTCYVHPQAVAERTGKELWVPYSDRSQSARIRVLSAPNILLHHFWVGERKPEPGTPEGPVVD
jgi:hypothetical protein